MSWLEINPTDDCCAIVEITAAGQRPCQAKCVGFTVDIGHIAYCEVHGGLARASAEVLLIVCRELEKAGILVPYFPPREKTE